MWHYYGIFYTKTFIVSIPLSKSLKIVYTKVMLNYALAARRIRGIMGSNFNLTSTSSNIRSIISWRIPFTIYYYRLRTAGLSAAIYAQRACLNTVVIEKTGISGGQILTTSEVDNYPGLPGIGGFDLGMKMRQHAENLNSQFVTGEVAKIAKIQDIFHITLTDGGILRSRTLIIATGASHQKLEFR